MKRFHRFALSTILAVIVLFSCVSAFCVAMDRYTVKSGDTLYIISERFGMTTAQLAVYNSLGTTEIRPGDKLMLIPNVKHYVQSGDTLWKLAQHYGTTIERIRGINGLASYEIIVGQLLFMPLRTPTPVPKYPSIQYVVQPGDTASSISKKFGVSASDLIKFNYMSENDWFDAEETIAINGYAPRYYSTVPNISSTPTTRGRLVDWFRDGRYLLKRNDVFRITDVQTGKYFSVKMMGGVKHSDVEPATSGDTAVLKTLFPTYVWAPRPVVIYKDGMNIAASLSGMPHSFDTVAGNGVTGHFDCYLYNSTAHSADTSWAYIEQHRVNVLKAAGL